MNDWENRENVFGYADGEKFRGLSPEEVFTGIFRENYWSQNGEEESVSGPGSSLEQTAVLREGIARLLREFDIRSVLDIPCGDFNWLGRALPPEISYIGGDIVAPLISVNQSRYAGPNRSFQHVNLISDPLPKCDLVICRDALVHFSFEDIRQALANIVRSGARRLLTTTFTGQQVNKDIVTGGWRPLNLQQPPFRLPAPLRLINEHCTEMTGMFADKCLALWEIPQLPLQP